MKINLETRAQWWLIPVKGDLLIYTSQKGRWESKDRFQRFAIVLGNSDWPYDTRMKGVYSVWTIDHGHEHWTINNTDGHEQWELWRSNS